MHSCLEVNPNKTEIMVAGREKHFEESAIIEQFPLVEKMQSQLVNSVHSLIFLDSLLMQSSIQNNAQLSTPLLPPGWTNILMHLSKMLSIFNETPF